MKIYWIWLSRLKFVGPVLQKSLIANFHNPKAVYDAEEEELLAVPKINKKALQSIISSRSLKEAENIQKAADRNGIKILLFYDDLYPNFAKEYKESPIVLYYLGDLRLVQTTVGVVGARRCTPYGKKIAEQLGEELAALNIPVISGFAKGIDSYAQAACAQNEGYTIAFLGCGPDICYPPEQRVLYHHILEKGGTFISKHPPGTPPTPKSFVARNALISAWSTELVIVEAGKQSGALWTADFAVKNHKPVYAVPNQITIPEGAGTNLLLSRGVPPYLGIHSLQAAKEIVKSSPKVPPTPSKENPILQLLSQKTSTIQQLSNQLSIDESEIMDQLFELEFDKQIVIRGNVVNRI